MATFTFTRLSRAVFRRLHVLVELLAKPELFPRLVYGSDYPVPALGGRIVGTRPQPLAFRHRGAFGAQLVTLGLLDAAHCDLLHEVRMHARTRARATSAHSRPASRQVFQFNPLLFDLVLKLTVRHPVTKIMLPAHVFGAHPLLPPFGQDVDATT